MTRRSQYRRYLNSPEWREQRDFALARTSGFCQFCGDFASDVHHVQYPKQFGHEHPDSLIPVCRRCHKTSHGIQIMKQLTNVVRMTALSPEGTPLKYLLSEAKVYASDKSWVRALQIPEGSMTAWFTQRLPMTCMLKKDFFGGDLRAEYEGTPVYRWHAVAETLREFDRAFNRHRYRDRPANERRAIEVFYEKYDRLVSWGHSLQESAIANALRPKPSNTPITEARLRDVVSDVVSQPLLSHETKLREHDVVIREIKSAVPAMGDAEEFITVRRAALERGFDPAMIPLPSQSRENLTGLAGQLLKAQGARQGTVEMTRLDGQSSSMAVPMNTYRRADIYRALDEILKQRPPSLF